MERKTLGIGTSLLLAGTLLVASKQAEAKTPMSKINKGMDNRPRAKEVIGVKEKEMKWELSLSEDFPAVTNPDIHYAQALGVFVDGTGYQSRVLKIDPDGHLEESLVFDKELAGLQIVTNQIPTERAVDIKNQVEMELGGQCFLDTMVGAEIHDAGTPPNLYFEVANSCAKEGELGHLNTDGTIEGYSRVVLKKDFDYLDKAGDQRTFNKGTVVYYPK